MRRTLALLLITACSAPALAGDKESKSRSKKKGDPAEIIVIDGIEYQPLPPPAGGAVVVVPPPVAPVAPVQVTPEYPAPLAHTPCVNCTDPSAGPKGTCPPRLASRICPKLENERRALDCFGCSTFRCEWRFLWGSCRAYYNEGPFKSHYPDNCPCDRK